MTLQVVTANRLIDGAVVYLSRDGGWSAWIEDSRLGASEAESAALLADGEAAVAARLIVEPYLIDVVEDDKAIWPVRYREVVRASGPSTHPAFGMQARRAAADRPAAA